MINVSRNSDPPESLNSPEIKQYINDAVQYLNDPENYDKPKKPQSYRNSDILEAFDKDFYSKCYLTEQKFYNSWQMDVEHFIPQAERPELVYEWTNLFPCDHYTNMIKPRKTPEGGYLNPCENGDDVENEIIYTLDDWGYDPYFEPRLPDNQKVINTCDLLNRVHNGHDDNTKKTTEGLRHAIHKRYIEILNKIVEWQRYPDGTEEKVRAARILKGLLSRKASFTMLCRSIPAVRQALPKSFLD